jgi:hypothetical protein
MHAQAAAMTFNLIDELQCSRTSEYKVLRLVEDNSRKMDIYASSAACKARQLPKQWKTAQLLTTTTYK